MVLGSKTKGTSWGPSLAPCKLWGKNKYSVFFLSQSSLSFASNYFIPYILHPPRITSHSKTLIGNIFSNVISPEITSGNITATISDHYPNVHLYLILCQIPLPKNLTIMRKIGVTYSKLINKMLIFLCILLSTIWIFIMSWMYMLYFKKLRNMN